MARKAHKLMYDIQDMREGAKAFRKSAVRNSTDCAQSARRPGEEDTHGCCQPAPAATIAYSRKHAPRRTTRPRCAFRRSLRRSRKSSQR
jgi:hypothetical protein